MKVGNVSVLLELDLSKAQAQLEDFRKQLNGMKFDIPVTAIGSFEKSFGKLNNKTIKPRVDHSELESLNRHLDVKLNHYKSLQKHFNNNPLRVKFIEETVGDKEKKKGKTVVRETALKQTVIVRENNQELNYLNQILKNTGNFLSEYKKAVKETNSVLKTVARIGGKANSDSNKRLGDINRSTKANKPNFIANVLSTMMGNNLSTVTDGLFKGIRQGLEKGLGVDFDLMGQQLGLLSSALGESALLLSGAEEYIAEFVTKIAPFAKEAEKFINKLRKSSALFDAIFARIALVEKQSEKIKQQKREGTGTEEEKRSRYKTNMRDIDAEMTDYTVSIDVLTAQLNQVNQALSAKIKSLNEQQIKIAKEARVKISKLDPKSKEADNIAKQATQESAKIDLQINKEKSEVEPIINKLESQISDLKFAQEDAKSRKEEIKASKPYAQKASDSIWWKEDPLIILKNLTEKTGVQIPPSLLPQIVAMDKSELPKDKQGALAYYNDEKNQIGVSSDLFRKLVLGLKLSTKEIEVFTHELSHAVTVGFGTFDPKYTSSLPLDPQTEEEKAMIADFQSLYSSTNYLHRGDKITTEREEEGRVQLNATRLTPEIGKEITVNRLPSEIASQIDQARQASLSIAKNAQQLEKENALENGEGNPEFKGNVDDIATIVDKQIGLVLNSSKELQSKLDSITPDLDTETFNKVIEEIKKAQDNLQNEQAKLVQINKLIAKQGAEISLSKAIKTNKPKAENLKTDLDLLGDNEKFSLQETETEGVKKANEVFQQLEKAIEEQEKELKKGTPEARNKVISLQKTIQQLITKIEQEIQGIVMPRLTEQLKENAQIAIALAKESPQDIAELNQIEQTTKETALTRNPEQQQQLTAEVQKLFKLYVQAQKIAQSLVAPKKPTAQNVIKSEQEKIDLENVLQEFDTVAENITQELEKGLGKKDVADNLIKVQELIKKTADTIQTDLLGGIQEISTIEDSSQRQSAIQRLESMNQIYSQAINKTNKALKTGFDIIQNIENPSEKANELEIVFEILEESLNDILRLRNIVPKTNYQPQNKKIDSTTQLETNENVDIWNEPSSQIKIEPMGSVKEDDLWTDEPIKTEVISQKLNLQQENIKQPAEEKPQPVIIEEADLGSQTASQVQVSTKLNKQDFINLTTALNALKESIETLTINLGGDVKLPENIATPDIDENILIAELMPDESSSALALTTEQGGGLSNYEKAGHAIQVVGSNLQRLGNTIQSVTAGLVRVASPVYKTLVTLEEGVGMFIPYFGLIKAGIQTAGKIGLGAAAFHYLPGGQALLEGAGSLGGNLALSGASGVTTAIAEGASAIPFIGPSLAAAGTGAVTALAETIGVGGASLLALGGAGQVMTNVAGKAFDTVNPEHLTGYGWNISQIGGEHEQALPERKKKGLLGQAKNALQGVTENIGQQLKTPESVTAELLPSENDKSQMLALPSQKANSQNIAKQLDSILTSDGIAKLIQVANTTLGTKLKAGNKKQNLEAIVSSPEAENILKLAKGELTDAKGNKLIIPNASESGRTKYRKKGQEITDSLPTISNKELSSLIVKVFSNLKEDLQDLSVDFNEVNLQDFILNIEKATQGLKRLETSFGLTKQQSSQIQGYKSAIAQLRTGTSKIKKEAPQLLQPMLSPQVGTLPDLESIKRGENYVEGIKKGAVEKTPELVKTFTHLGNVIDNTMKMALDEHSPSKKGKQKGKWYVEGIEEGVTEESKGLFSTLKNIGKQITDSLGITVPEQNYDYYSDDKVKEKINKVRTQKPVVIPERTIEDDFSLDPIVAKESVIEVMAISRASHKQDITDLVARKNVISQLPETDENNARIKQIEAEIKRSQGFVKSYNSDLKREKAELAKLKAVKAEQITSSSNIETPIKEVMEEVVKTIEESVNNLQNDLDIEFDFDIPDNIPDIEEIVGTVKKSTKKISQLPTIATPTPNQLKAQTALTVIPSTPILTQEEIDADIKRFAKYLESKSNPVNVPTENVSLPSGEQLNTALTVVSSPSSLLTQEEIDADIEKVAQHLGLASQQIQKATENLSLPDGQNNKLASITSLKTTPTENINEDNTVVALTRPSDNKTPLPPLTQLNNKAKNEAKKTGEKTATQLENDINDAINVALETLESTISPEELDQDYIRNQVIDAVDDAIEVRNSVEESLNLQDALTGAKGIDPQIEANYEIRRQQDIANRTKDLRNKGIDENTIDEINAQLENQIPIENLVEKIKRWVKETKTLKAIGTGGMNIEKELTSLRQIERQIANASKKNKALPLKEVIKDLGIQSESMIDMLYNQIAKEMQKAGVDTKILSNLGNEDFLGTDIIEMINSVFEKFVADISEGELQDPEVLEGIIKAKLQDFESYMNELEYILQDAFVEAQEMGDGMRGDLSPTDQALKQVVVQVVTTLDDNVTPAIADTIEQFNSGKLFKDLELPEISFGGGGNGGNGGNNQSGDGFDWGSFFGNVRQSAENLGESLTRQYPILQRFGGGINNLWQIGKAFIFTKLIGGLFSKITDGAFEAALQVENLQRALSFSTGENGGIQLERIRKEAQELGIGFIQAAEGVRQFSASTMGTSLNEQATPLVSQFQKSFAAFGLSGEQQEGAFLALSQMASKGVVSMEELRTQLAERLPGALGAAARSMGMSIPEFNKLVETGQVLAEDLLPKMASQLEIETAIGLATSAKSTQAELTRLENNIFSLQAGIGQLQLTLTKLGLPIINKALSLLQKEALTLAIGVGVFTVGSFVAFIATLKATTVGAFVLNGAIKILSVSLKAMWASMLPILPWVVAAIVVTKVASNLWKTITAGTKEIKEYTNSLKELAVIEAKIRKNEKPTGDNKRYDRDFGLFGKDINENSWDAVVDFTTQRSTRMANEFINDSKMANEALQSVTDSIINASKKTRNIDIGEGVTVGNDLSEDTITKVQDRLATLRTQSANLKFEIAVLADKGDLEKVKELQDELGKVNKEIGRVSTEPFAEVAIMEKRLKAVQALAEQFELKAEEMTLKGLDSRAKSYAMLAEEARRKEEDIYKLIEKANEAKKEANDLYTKRIQSLRQLQRELAKINYMTQLEGIDNQITAIQRRTGGETSEYQFDQEMRQARAVEVETKLKLSTEAFNIYENDVKSMLGNLDADLKTQIATEIGVADLDKALMEKKVSPEAFAQLTGDKVSQEIKDRVEQSQDLRELIDKSQDYLTTWQDIKQQQLESANVVKEQFDATRQRKSDIRDFLRQLEDLDLQIADYFRQRARGLEDFETQYQDIAIQNQRQSRDLLEQYQDLGRTLNLQLLQAQNQLATLEKDIKRQSLTNQARQSLNFGADGLFSGFINLIDELMVSENEFDAQELTLNEQRLQTEEEVVNIARQVRSLQEQSYDAERQRVQQLRDLMRAQEDWIIQQKASWTAITRQVEDMERQAKEMGIAFTGIAEHLDGINGSYLKIHNAIADMAEQIQNSANNMSVGGSGGSGTPTGNVVTPVAGLNMDSNNQWGASRDGGRRTHWKVDYPMPDGTPVVSPIDGEITKLAYDEKTQDYHIIVKFGDTEIIMGHLRNMTVKLGDMVSAGQQLGTSWDGHLDYGVKDNGQWIHPFKFHSNPEQYLGANYKANANTSSGSSSNTSTNKGNNNNQVTIKPNNQTTTKPDQDELEMTKHLQKIRVARMAEARQKLISTRKQLSDVEQELKAIKTSLGNNPNIENRKQYDAIVKSVNQWKKAVEKAENDFNYWQDAALNGQKEIEVILNKRKLTNQLNAEPNTKPAKPKTDNQQQGKLQEEYNQLRKLEKPTPEQIKRRLFLEKQLKNNSLSALPLNFSTPELTKFEVNAGINLQVQDIDRQLESISPTLNIPANIVEGTGFKNNLNFDTNQGVQVAQGNKGRRPRQEKELSPIEQKEASDAALSIMNYLGMGLRGVQEVADTVGTTTQSGFSVAGLMDKMGFAIDILVNVIKTSNAIQQAKTLKRGSSLEKYLNVFGDLGEPIGGMSGLAFSQYLKQQVPLLQTPLGSVATDVLIPELGEVAGSGWGQIFGLISYLANEKGIPQAIKLLNEIEKELEKRKRKNKGNVRGNSGNRSSNDVQQLNAQLNFSTPELTKFELNASLNPIIEPKRIEDQLGQMNFNLPIGLESTGFKDNLNFDTNQGVQVAQTIKLRDLMREIGFPENTISDFIGIFGAESSFNPNALNDAPSKGGLAYGLGQVNMFGDLGPARRAQFGLKSNDELYDIRTNLKAVLAIYREAGNSFRPWVETHGRGTHRKFMNADPTVNLANNTVNGVGSAVSTSGGNFHVPSVTRIDPSEYNKKMAEGRNQLNAIVAGYNPKGINESIEPLTVSLDKGSTTALAQIMTDTAGRIVINSDTVNPILADLKENKLVSEEVMKDLLYFRDTNDYIGMGNYLEQQGIDLASRKDEINQRLRADFEAKREKERLENEKKIVQQGQQMVQSIYQQQEAVRSLNLQLLQYNESIYGYLTASEKAQIVEMERTNQWKNYENQLRNTQFELRKIADFTDNPEQAKEAINKQVQDYLANTDKVNTPEMKQQVMLLAQEVNNGTAPLIELIKLFEKLNEDFYNSKPIHDATTARIARFTREVNRLGDAISALQPLVDVFQKIDATVAIGLRKDIAMMEIDKQFEEMRQALENNIGSLQKELENTDLIGDERKFVEQQLKRSQDAINKLTPELKIKIKVKEQLDLDFQNIADQISAVLDISKKVAERAEKENPFEGARYQAEIRELEIIIDLQNQLKAIEDARTKFQDNPEVLNRLDEYEKRVKQFAEVDLSRFEQEVNVFAKAIKDPLNNAFKGLFSDFIRGTKTLKDLFIDFANSVADFFADLAAKFATQWVMDKLFPPKNKEGEDSKEGSAGWAIKQFEEMWASFNGGQGNNGNNNGITYSTLPLPKGFEIPQLQPMSTNIEDMTSNVTYDILQSNPVGTMNINLPPQMQQQGGSNILGGLFSGLLSGVTSGIAGGFGGIFTGANPFSGGAGLAMPSSFVNPMDFLSVNNPLSFASGINLTPFSKGGVIESAINSYLFGGVVSSFSKGGKVNDVDVYSVGGVANNIKSFSRGGNIIESASLGLSVMKAMKKEGSNAVPIVAHIGERLLSAKTGDAQIFNQMEKDGIWDEYKRNRFNPEVKSFNAGGIVGNGIRQFTRNYNNTNTNRTQNTIINVSTPDALSFRKSRSQIAQEEKLAQKRMERFK